MEENEIKKEATFMDFNQMPIAEKLKAVRDSQEIADCIKLLYAVYKDTKLNSFISFDIEIEGEYFEFRFQKFTKQAYL